MHRLINLIFICIISSMQAVQSAQTTFATSHNNRFPYISTPHTVRSGTGKPLRPTAMEELFEYARVGNIQKLVEMRDEYGTLDEPLEGFTGIYHATVAGRLESVKYFTYSGAHMTRFFPVIDQQQAYSSNDLVQEIPLVETLLDVAIKQGHRDVALFLAQFIPLWFPNGRGELPLCNAFRWNRPYLAFALIKNNTSYNNYLAAQESTKEAETALSCALRLGYRDVADFITLALHLPSSQTEEPLQTAPGVSERTRLMTSRWVVLPGLCALTIGALYLIKAQTPKPFLESLAQVPIFYRV